MSTSILFYPNFSKRSKKRGLVPIYMRLLHYGKKKEKKLNLTLKNDEENIWNINLMRIDKKNSSTNDYLKKIEDEFITWNKENATTSNKASVEQIMNKILGLEKKINQCLVLNYCEKYYNEFILNSGLTEGTKKNYRKSINHFHKFLLHHKLQNIEIVNFSRLEALTFKSYLLTIPRKNNRNMKEWSASTIIKKLKAIFSYALQCELIKSNPFMGVKLSNMYQTKDRLNIQDIIRIKELDLSENLSLDIYRDQFLFCSTTGLSFSDFQGLKLEHIKVNNEGINFLEMNRNKTNIKIKQFLPNFSIKLIEKYKLHPEVINTDRVFPKRSLNNANEKLKVIAAKAQISINLSTHIARHSFKQILAEAEINELATLYSIMGWSTGGNIALNYTIPTESLLIKAKNKLDNFLTILNDRE